jgi:hypothetical protein
MDEARLPAELGVGEGKALFPAVGVEEERRALDDAAVPAVDGDDAGGAGELEPVVLRIVDADDLEIGRIDELEVAVAVVRELP